MSEIDRLQACHDLALKVAPELSAAPLYFLPSLPSHYSRVAGACLAFATRRRDVQIRARLVADGRWQGPGPTICFADQTLSLSEMLAVTVHEISHLLPASEPQADSEPTGFDFAKNEFVLAVASADSKRKTLPPWHDHGADFIRRVLHTGYRGSVRGGHTFEIADVNFGGACYGLSSGVDYLVALGDEPARMVDATFQEVAATDTPAEFLQLFEHDTRKWNHDHGR